MCRFQHLFTSKEMVIDIYSNCILIIFHYDYRKVFGLFNQAECMYLSHIL